MDLRTSYHQPFSIRAGCSSIISSLRSVSLSFMLVMFYALKPICRPDLGIFLMVITQNSPMAAMTTLDAFRYAMVLRRDLVWKHKYPWRHQMERCSQLLVVSASALGLVSAFPVMRGLDPMSYSLDALKFRPSFHNKFGSSLVASDSWIPRDNSTNYISPRVPGEYVSLSPSWIVQ